ncbi:ABC transporter [Marinobacter sp.]|uniref:ABC transporter n=1 Tax=Marinobacter sp. TaxID=50741 RepID=UPI0034A490E1
MTDWFWLLLPIAASLLMATSLVPLGQRVLERNVVFADLAIAQWAALGAIAGGQLLPNAWSRFEPAAALGFAMVAVVLVQGAIRIAPDRREAMIGLLYVLGACAATLLVSRDPHGAQRLNDAFNGDLLWVTGSSLIPLALVAGLVWAWHVRLAGLMQERLFLPLFALAVTVCVNQAGIYVVFASLIATPLLIGCMRGRSTAATVLTCFAGHTTGLLLSAGYDLPAGPTIVVSVIAGGLVAMLLLRAPDG